MVGFHKLVEEPGFKSNHPLTDARIIEKMVVVVVVVCALAKFLSRVRCYQNYPVTLTLVLTRA